MTDPTLPDELAKYCGAFHRKLIEDLVKIQPRLLELAGQRAHQAILAQLDTLLAGRFRQVARASYLAGLSEAGEAAQAVEDLATVRKAFAILAKGER
jgi:hypothetical protein